MKFAKQKKKILSAFLTFTLALGLWAGFPAVKTYAASGTVYTCTINRCYAHPVTGVIEDSGGEASYATGQGMVEGCIYPTGILELTDSGEYYLTVRASLMDYTSGHSFQVQNVGDSGWSTPAMGQTGTGTDSNGTTADICIQVPSENCVVRGSMYVDPMGRDVTFYFYPSNYTEGNNTDMTATMVTESSGVDTVAQQSEGSGSDTVQSSGESVDAGSVAQASNSDLTSDSGESTTASSGSSSGSSLQSSGSLNSGSSSLQSSGTTASSSDTSKSSSSGSSAKKLESSITEAAKPSSETSLDTQSSTLDSAQGLSLSTAKDVEGVDDSAEGGAIASTSGSRIFGIAAAVTITGLILMGAAAGIVYFFRRNWRRWGGAEDDEE